jgi:hypothetical protein
LNVGRFGQVNGRVEQRLRALAATRRDFDRGGDGAGRYRRSRGRQTPERQR